jgi:hypothetical protein
VVWSDAPIYHYKPGVGASLGPVPLTTGHLMTSSNILYVDSTSGDDNYAGAQRQRPLATFGAALSAASDWQIIVLLENHSETLTSLSSIAHKATIWGEGLDANGEPTAELGFDGVGASLSATDWCYLRNIRFTANQSSGNTTPRLRNDSSGNAAQFHMRDCVVECDQYDTVAGLRLTGVSAAVQNHRIEHSKFVSVQTDPALAPQQAIELAGDIEWFLTEDLEIDGGTSGFVDEAMKFTGTGLGYHMLNTVLRNGADIDVIDVSTTDARHGYIHFSARTESTYVSSDNEAA